MRRARRRPVRCLGTDFKYFCSALDRRRPRLRHIPKKQMVLRTPKVTREEEGPSMDHSDTGTLATGAFTEYKSA